MKLKEGICCWAKLNLFLFACMIIIRLFFYFEVHTRLEIEATQFWGVMKGVVFDFFLLSHIMTWLLLPFIVLYRYFPKTTSKVYTGLIFLYVVVASLLTEYYCNLTMPLDHVILVYTPEEVKGTATSSANITAAPFLWFFGALTIVILLALLWRKVKVGWTLSVAMLLLSIVITCCVRYKNVIREERYYKDHTSFCLAVNQPSYSYIKITDYLKNSKKTFIGDDNMATAQVLEASERYHQLYPEFTFVDNNYPFFRKADDKDVLGSFFDRTSDSLPPNFVFIIVESFGQRLTGVDDPKISFTPFIDSLKQEGLYWKNCLSTTERTFGVLPGIFASAPYGLKGFSQPTYPMPNHNSLLKDFIDNGYETSYYYGGVHSFDRFDRFLKANKTGFIYVPEINEVDSAVYKSLADNNRWGLDDRETFQYVKQRKSSMVEPRPNVDIIMTLTTHEPFLFPDLDAYEPRVKAMMSACAELSERERTNIERNLNVFSCYLYMDDCVRDLFAFYQTLPEYKNTIFVITGDHRMASMSVGGPLNKYNVPLLIYSPLLRQPKTMDAVVSHLNITPSLNAYLSANYPYQIDEYCHWRGGVFDTVKEYRNTLRQAFMLNNRDVVDYVNGDYVISNNRLFKLNKDLMSEPAENEVVLMRLRKELEDFQTISQFAVQNDHMLNYTQEERRILLQQNTDLESRYSSVFDNYVHQEDDNHYALVEPNDMYPSLCDFLLLEDNYDELVLDFAFDLQSLDTLATLPVVTVHLEDYYMYLHLESPEGISLNTGNLEHYRYRLFVPVEEECKGKYLKIYFYNPHGASMKYDNIQVRVSAL